MKVYKLTDKNNQTRNKTQWGENVTHETDGSGDLCGPGWLHAYSDPLLAVLLNPIHADFYKPRLWEAQGEGISKDEHGLKLGFTKLTTLREIPLPKVSTEQRVRFAIYCALEVCKEPAFVSWAEKWLDGSDRTLMSAQAAQAAQSAEESVNAVWAEAQAAAAWATEAAAAAWASDEFAEAAAARAVQSAAWAGPAGHGLDLTALAHKAIN